MLWHSSGMRDSGRRLGHQILRRAHSPEKS